MRKEDNHFMKSVLFIIAGILVLSQSLFDIPSKYFVKTKILGYKSSD